MANILYRKQKQQKSLDNGVTWIDTGEYRVGDIIENPSNCSSTDSKQCRWVELPEGEGYYCDGVNKYTMQVEECTENGLIWTRTGNSQRGNTLIESNSTDCGYEQISFNEETITSTTGTSYSISSLDGKYIISSGIVDSLYAVYDNKYYYRYSRTSFRVYDLEAKELSVENVSTPTLGTQLYKEYDITNRVLPNKVMMPSGYLNLDTLEYKGIGNYVYSSPTKVVVEKTYEKSYELYNLENDSVEELDLYYEMVDVDTIPSSENYVEPEYPKECFKECIVGEDMGSTFFKKGETVYVRMRYNNVKYVLGEKMILIKEAIICKKSTEFENVLIHERYSPKYDILYSNGVITKYANYSYWFEDDGYYQLSDRVISNGMVTIDIDSLEEVDESIGYVGSPSFFSNYRLFDQTSVVSYSITDYSNLTKYSTDISDKFDIQYRDRYVGYTNTLFKNGEPNPFTNEKSGIVCNAGFSYENKFYAACVGYTCGKIKHNDSMITFSFHSIYLNKLDGNLLVNLSLDDGNYLFLDIPIEEFIKCTELKYIEFNI